MTPQEIKENAPDGATHYFVCEDGDILYYSFFESKLKWFNSGVWRFCFDPQEKHYLNDNLKPL